jgi:hypothetical protein
MDSKPTKQNHPNRRVTDTGEAHGRRASLESRMEARMDAFESKLDENTKLTQNVVNVFGTLESGIKVLGWLGAVAKWVVTVGSAIGIVWAIVHGKPVEK